MSFGDPNTPYGQPPQAPQQPAPGQPGYGYPQQAPQGYPQQGYGYPQGQPVGPYGADGFGMAMEMPGGVKAARVMLFILGGLQALGGLLAIIASAWINELISDTAASSPQLNGRDVAAASTFGVGLMVGIGVVILAIAAWAIFTGVKFGTGRGGARASAIVYASLLVLFSVISLVGANIFALISLVLGILIIVFCANSGGSRWFTRPRA